jgi:hypothetical protein
MGRIQSIEAQTRGREEKDEGEVEAQKNKTQPEGGAFGI